MPSTTSCNPKRLTDFVAKRLNEIQVIDLERHLSEYTICRDALAQQTADDEDLKWRIDDSLSPDAIQDRVKEIGREIDTLEM